MAREPQIAKRSVLLDYVSPDLITALLRSLKRKDIQVVLALLGTILNKFLIILSTGLFTAANVNVALEPVATRGGRSFSGSFLNSSMVSQKPVARVFGIETLNMSYSFGTTSTYATEIPPSRISRLISQVILAYQYTNFVKQMIPLSTIFAK